MSAVTPNEPEAEAALGLNLSAASEAVAAAEKILADQELDAVRDPWA